jgi:predicted HNH restriction endonuclease
MNYYFINTDRVVREDVRTCDLWFDHRMAFSGGDYEKYGKPLYRLGPLDRCLMYHNRVGIVGVGRPLERWDGKPHSNKIVYTKLSIEEYRLSFDWYIDIRDNPIKPKSEFGYVPRGLLNPILKHKDIAVELLKRLDLQGEFRSADELYVSPDLQEGNVRNVTVNIHERNRDARSKCIEHYGSACNVCGFTYSKFYGPLGNDYIQVHHISPISKATSSRKVDPILDLRPVCANCHSIIHKKYPPYSIEEVKELIKDNKMRG